MNARLKPLKRFGQNFLVDQNIREKIFRALALTPSDAVLEIGPGDGALTFVLASAARRVVAVELDRGRSEELRKRAEGVKNLDVCQGDILKFDLKAAAGRHKVSSFVVVANIPYYITTPILEYLFAGIGLVKDIYLMVQKELGERLVARPGTKTYGALTCFVDYFTLPEILFPVKAGSFRPVPKVDSCFMRLRPWREAERPWTVKSEEKFFEVVRAAFGQRRKTLKASLSRIAGKKELSHVVPQELLCARPEVLALADFAALANQLFDFSHRG